MSTTLKYFKQECYTVHIMNTVIFPTSLRYIEVEISKEIKNIYRLSQIIVSV